MHGWRLPPRKIYLSFKTMKNIEIADPVLTMIGFKTKVIFYTKRNEDTLSKYDSEAFLSSHHG